MKMSVFFKNELVTWTVKLQNDYVKMFEKALRKNRAQLVHKTKFKNGSTEVIFLAVCNSLLSIGIDYGILCAELKNNESVQTPEFAYHQEQSE
jgi:hypothetical protein